MTCSGAYLLRRMRLTSLGRMALLTSAHLRRGLGGICTVYFYMCRYEDWIQLVGTDASGFNIANAWKSKVGNRGEGNTEHFGFDCCCVWSVICVQLRTSANTYELAMGAWQSANCKCRSCLLTGVTLEKAKQWAEETLDEAEESEEALCLL